MDSGAYGGSGDGESEPHATRGVKRPFGDGDGPEDGGDFDDGKDEFGFWGQDQDHQDQQDHHGQEETGWGDYGAMGGSNNYDDDDDNHEDDNQDGNLINHQNDNPEDESHQDDHQDDAANDAGMRPQWQQQPHHPHQQQTHHLDQNQMILDGSSKENSPASGPLRQAASVESVASSDAALASASAAINNDVDDDDIANDAANINDVDDDHYESDNEPLPPVPHAPRHPSQLPDAQASSSALAASSSSASAAAASNADAIIGNNSNGNADLHLEDGEAEEGELSINAPLSPPLDPHSASRGLHSNGAFSNNALLGASLEASRLNASSASSISSGSGRYLATSPEWPGTRSPDIRSRTSNGRPESRRFHGCSSDSEYEFHKKVGEGTFGEVTIGMHKPTGTIVALKRILVQNEKEGLPITALREIKILKALSHNNIITLREIAYQRGDRNKRERGNVFMVFPYMDHDLTGLLQNPQVRFTPAQIKSYTQQILLGIDYLHKNKIMHRDVKGSNILIDNSGSLRIADFGLARAFTGNEAKGYTNLVVTRWYRPPELLMGAEKYTTSIDIWGVGCVLGEILRRRPIMTGTDDSDQLEKIFMLCGTPDDITWPGYRNLPMFNPAKGSAISDFKTRHRRVIHEKFPPNHYHRATVALLDVMLSLDPSRRPTASEALEHEYFFIFPPPARPGTTDFEPWPTSHELELRQAKSEEAAASAAAAAASGGQPARSTYSQLPAHFDANYVANRGHGRSSGAVGGGVGGVGGGAAGVGAGSHSHSHSRQHGYYQPSPLQHGNVHPQHRHENGVDHGPPNHAPGMPHDQQRRYHDQYRSGYAPPPHHNGDYDRERDHRPRDRHEYRYGAGSSTNNGSDDRHTQWQ